ncbi:hypothetical protein PUN28_003152 [Cardiocondyla obscurior]|uniref:Uncharacterized protein n=1 Tax=Cardiocondyla obscurior TaxID=286306 RepID=A0AAW2GJC2_9HYME
MTNCKKTERHNYETCSPGTSNFNYSDVSLSHFDSVLLRPHIDNPRFFFFSGFLHFFDPLTRPSAYLPGSFFLLPPPSGPILIVSLAWNIPEDERKDPVINYAEIRMHFLFNSVRNVTVPRETRSNKKMSIVESKIASSGYTWQV